MVLVDALVALWLRGISCNVNRAEDKMTLWPAPDDDFVNLMAPFYDQLFEMRPGFCDNCHHWSMRREDAYWGAHPHYCPRCMDAAVTLFQEYDRWPEVKWES